MENQKELGYVMLEEFKERQNQGLNKFNPYSKDLKDSEVKDYIEKAFKDIQIEQYYNLDDFIEDVLFIRHLLKLNP